MMKIYQTFASPLVIIAKCNFLHLSLLSLSLSLSDSTSTDLTKIRT